MKLGIQIMSMKKTKNILAGISAILLFGALLEGWPYGYFTLLRFVVFIASGYIAYNAYRLSNKEFWMYSFGLLTILFNPIVPIHLSRDMWVVIDLVVGVFMIISIFKLKFKQDENQR